MTEDARGALEAIYRTHAPTVLATLIRLLRNFDLAEEALSEAFQAAITQWPRDGTPANPRAWLVSTGRFKIIDRLRKRSRFDAVKGEIAEALSTQEPESEAMIEDDRLRLLFICCHPALPIDAQVALALRSLCGLTTEEIAHAFLVPTPTVAQRIVRAKTKIRDEKISYNTPTAEDLPVRLDGVLQVLYLVFNQGYDASVGGDVARCNFCAESIRMARELVELLPDGEAIGLLALMLLQDSRRDARIANGEIVLLADQDRSLWNTAQIKEGVALVDRALGQASIGRFALQAAIAAVHATAVRAEETNWARIVGLYDLLMRSDPSPIVALNRAVAVAMHDGPQAGLDLIEPILESRVLEDYRYAHSARGELCLRLGLKDEAARSYERALTLTPPELEHRFLRRKLVETRGF